MSETFKVYKGDEVVGEMVKSEVGKTKITINNLEPGTEYVEGTFHVVLVNEHGESKKQSVPTFKTKESKRKKTKQ